MCSGTGVTVYLEQSKYSCTVIGKIQGVYLTLWKHLKVKCNSHISKCLSVESIPVIFFKAISCFLSAAELRTLSSDTLAKMVSMTVKKGPVTIGDILTTLSNMVTVSECDVFGYLGLEGDIIILVAPVTQNPTSLQVM